jgi:preprotein translocase subunit YajC
VTPTTAALAAAGAPQGYITFLPFILIFVVFYFFLIRPGQQRQRKWQEMLGKLKAGDRITTTGGLRGVILSIKEDVVQLRVPPDSLRLEIVKSSIASVSTSDEETK